MPWSVTDGMTDPGFRTRTARRSGQRSWREVYQLGNHRLMCGDSASVEDLDTSAWMASPSILANTDPPYGRVKLSRVQQQRDRRWFIEFSGQRRRRHITRNLDVERHPEKANATHKKVTARKIVLS